MEYNAKNNLWVTHNGRGFSAEQSEFAEIAARDVDDNEIISTYAKKSEVYTLKPHGDVEIYSPGDTSVTHLVEVPNNKTSYVHNTICTEPLTINVMPEVNTSPNFAVEIKTDVDCEVEVRLRDETPLAKASSAVSELKAGKCYQLTCVGYCWTCAEFEEIPHMYFLGSREYHTVDLNGKVWMAENLDYWDSNIALNPSESTTTPSAWYQPGGSGFHGKRYGLLYNGYALEYIMANQDTLFPGWHVPTAAEWESLFESVGEYDTGLTIGWKNCHKFLSVRDWTGDGNANDGTNETGMNVHPTGWRHNNSFGYLNDLAFVWSATPNDTDSYTSYEFNDIYDRIRKDLNRSGMADAIPIRLVKNLDEYS